MIYEPREDSYLLQKHIKKYCKKDYIVLDMGTGSGIQAKEAAKYCKKVTAVDIQKNVIKRLKKEQSENKKRKILRKINYKVSDLFSNIKQKFDLIIFNPPYLPQDVGIDDIAIYGGKKGYELIEKFLSQVNNYLKPDGKILLLFSSLSKEKKVVEFIEKYGLKYKFIGGTKVFFEKLSVVLLEKDKLVKTLEKREIKNIEVFGHGKRGLLYAGKLGGTKIAIKTKYPKSQAIGRIQNEIRFLKILNKKGIGTKMLFYDKEYFAYKFISGKYIKEFIETEKSKSKLMKVLRNILEQCFVMDKLKINKEEMHNPYKHIVINKTITMIDFERATYAAKSHNITQFLQYIMKNKVFLDKRGFNINKKTLIKLGKEYKRNINKKNFDRIIKEIY